MNKKHAFKSLLLAFAFVLTLFAGYGRAFAIEAGDGQELINIVSINDLHGNVEEGGKNPGLAKLAGVLDQMKESNQTLFFSAGDNFQGTAISNLTHGEVVNKAFAAMDLQASAIGNHEYDWGKDMMTSWAAEGNYPFLAANIVYKGTNDIVDYAKPYEIKEVTLEGGKVVKIGFIGIATPETASKTTAANVADIEFTDPAAAANKYAQILRDEEGVDAVVALTHLGAFQNAETGVISGEVSDFANAVEGIDLILTGHTHQTVDGKINDIQILQGYYSGRSLQVGQLVFNKETGKLEAVDGYVNEIYKEVANLPVNEEVSAIIAEYKDQLAPILNEKIGVNEKELAHNTDVIGVTPMGQWSAKSLADIGGTEIGIINGGGIREGMPAGDITMSTMYTIFPFDNTLVTLDVTGEHLHRLIEHGIQSGSFRDGQFYGIKVVYDMSKPYGERIVSMTDMDGNPIDPEATYSVSTLDFIYTGGDKYDFTGATNVVDTFQPVRDLLVEYIKDAETINHTFDETTFVPVGEEPIEDTKPEDTKPEDTKPEETKPEDTKPEETKPDCTKPEETKPCDDKYKDKDKDKDNKDKDNKGKDNKGKDNKGNKDDKKDGELPFTGSAASAIPVAGLLFTAVGVAFTLRKRA